MAEVYAFTALEMSGDEFSQLAETYAKSFAKFDFPKLYHKGMAHIPLVYPLEKPKDSFGLVDLINTTGAKFKKDAYQVIKHTKHGPPAVEITVPKGTINEIVLAHYAVNDQYYIYDAIFQGLGIKIRDAIDAVFSSKYLLKLANKPHGHDEKVQHLKDVKHFIIDVKSNLTDLIANQLKGDDYIAGSVKGDHLLGFAGNDTMYGDQYDSDKKGGKDILDGGKGDDTLDGGKGSDTLIGGKNGSGGDWASYQTSYGKVYVSLAETVDANKQDGHKNVNREWDDGNGGNSTKGDVFSGIENLRGSVFDDKLTGDSHANIIEGGFGADLMKGGGGKDIFLYTSLYDGNDKLLDFEPKDDKGKIDDTIRLNHTAFNWTDSRFDGAEAGHKENLRITDFVITSDGQPIDGNSHIIYNQETGDLSYDLDGNGTGYQTLVFANIGAHLEGLSNSNFELVV